MIFLLLFICEFVYAEKINPRSVNLALDTILEFNNKDNTDLQLIDNVQSFLNKIKHVLKDRNARRTMNSDLKFTDFIIQFIEIIKKYEDDDLEDVVAVLDDEMRKYHYVGCKFYELFQNSDIRRFVGRKLDESKNKRANELRSDFDTYVQLLKDRFNMEMDEFFNYINNLYTKESRAKFRKFLNNMELYRSKSKRANLGLIKIVRQGIRDIIFDHYTNLNVNARRDFKIRLETFWKNFMDPYKVEHKVWNLKYTKNDKANVRGVKSTVSAPITNESKDSQSTQTTTEVLKTDKPELPKENTVSTKPTESNIQRDNVETLFSIKSTTKADVGVFMKDFFSMIKNPLKTVTKRDEDDIFGSFSEEVTNRSIIKQFEKSIDVHIPDIPKMVRERFDYATKDKIIKHKDTFLKDFHLNVIKSDLTTKKEEKIKKHKTKLRDKILKTPKRFSIVTTERTTYTENDVSLETSEEVETTTEKHTTRKHRPKTTKRKHKETKATRSRFISLFPEDYTTKAKKIKKEKVTKKRKSHKSKKDKKIERKKDKKDEKLKIRDITMGDYEEITETTTKAKKLKGKHDRPKHKKRKNIQQPTMRSEKTTKKSRKWLKLPKSSEGMTIESFETQRSYRKNIDVDNFPKNETGIKANQTTVKINYNVTKLTQSAANMTPPQVNFETTARSFGRLDYWSGTTKFRSFIAKTTILPNSTIHSEENAIDSKEFNDTNFVPRSFDLNNTFNNRKNNINDTIRFIDVHNIEYDATKVGKLLNITTESNTTQTFENKVISTPKSTEQTSTANKPTTTEIKTKAPVQRRSISVASVKQEITTTKPTETTPIKNVKVSIQEIVGLFNNSEVLNDFDTRRKNMFRDKIHKDMQAMFNPTTTTTTTTENIKFTDPFNELEDALGI